MFVCDWLRFFFVLYRNKIFIVFQDNDNSCVEILFFYFHWRFQDSKTMTYLKRSYGSWQGTSRACVNRTGLSNALTSTALVYVYICLDVSAVCVFFWLKSISVWLWLWLCLFRRGRVCRPVSVSRPDVCQRCGIISLRFMSSRIHTYQQAVHRCV